MDDVERALRDLPDMARPAERAVERFVQSAGQSVEVAYATMESPIGVLILAATRAGLIRIGFENEPGVLDDLAHRVSPRILEYPVRLEPAQRELEEYFEGRREVFEVPVDDSLIGGFRARVLAATARIPYGSVATYGEIAARAGRPTGARATGRALGGNPIPIIIPCHRVLRTGGGLGGYAGGLHRKEHLLRLEGALNPE